MENDVLDLLLSLVSSPCVIVMLEQATIGIFVSKCLFQPCSQALFLMRENFQVALVEFFVFLRIGQQAHHDGQDFMTLFLNGQVGKQEECAGLLTLPLINFYQLTNTFVCECMLDVYRDTLCLFTQWRRQKRHRRHWRHADALGRSSGRPS